MRTSAPKTRIREVRKNRGFTLKELARKIETTPQTVQRLETANMTVSMKWLEKIAAALRVAPHDLLVPVEDRSPEGQFIEAMRAALVRFQRNAPKFSLAHMIEAQGELASRILESEAGLRPFDEAAKAAAMVAAIAMRISMDWEKLRATSGPKLVENAA